MLAYFFNRPLPPGLEGLADLALDLRWTWSHSTDQLWETLDPEAWERTGNPHFILQSVSQARLEEAAADPKPLGAGLDVPIGFREEYGGSVFFDSNTVLPAVNLFLARHGVAPTGRILIEEFCIEPQSELFVTGTITENPGIEVRPLFRKKDEPRPTATKSAQPDADAPEVIRLSSLSPFLTAGALTQQSRIAAALNKAGIQNPNAWSVAGVPYAGRDSANATAVLPEEADSVAKDAPQEPLQLQPGFNLKPTLVLMKGPDDAPFLFCSHGAQPRVRTSAWKPVAMLCAGTALMFAGFCVLLLKMHLL